jgi:hypothetical protein
MSRIIVLLSVVFVAPVVVTGQPVSFRAPALKAAVEAQLHVTDPTPADMLKLAYLVAAEKHIDDLAGLEFAVNLATLNLIANSISNLSALKGLVNLTRVCLADNAIADGCPEVRIRRGYQILDAARPYSGWNLDDILLYTRP